MEEFQLREAEFNTLCDRIAQLLQPSKQTEASSTEIQPNPQEKREAPDTLTLVDALSEEAQTVLDSEKILLSHFAGDIRQKCRKITKGQRMILAQLRTQTEEMRAAMLRKDLLGDHKVDVNMETQGQLMQHGLEILADSKESLQNSVQVVAQTVEVGRKTAGKLEHQGEQMARQIDVLDTMEHRVDRSITILRGIATRIATDKYTCCLIWLVVAAIVFIFLYKRYG